MFVSSLNEKVDLHLLWAVLMKSRVLVLIASPLIENVILHLLEAVLYT